MWKAKGWALRILAFGVFAFAAFLVVKSFFYPLEYSPMWQPSDDIAILRSIYESDSERVPEEAELARIVRESHLMHKSDYEGKCRGAAIIFAGAGGILYCASAHFVGGILENRRAKKWKKRVGL